MIDFLSQPENRMTIVMVALLTYVAYKLIKNYK